MMKSLNTLLIKPAGPDCNLNCEYCFYLKKKELFLKKNHLMDIKTLKIMVKQALDQNNSEVHFAWQGGEPTLMGLEFFNESIRLQKKWGKGKKITNSLQTNGILIDEKWADFFKQHDFLIGLSLDGPEFVHNYYRKNRKGEGSFKKSLSAAKMLLKKGVAVNALTVISDYSAKYPKQIYKFLKELGLNYMQFIPCVEWDPKKNQIASFSVDPKQYGEFLKDIFDLWWEDFKGGRPTTFIRYFESLFFICVGIIPPMCTLQSRCGNYLVVEHNGNVYSCDFYVDPQNFLGNIHDLNLFDMLNSPKHTVFGEQKGELTEACCQCKWLKFCQGGCTKDRINKDQVSYLCSSYRTFLEYAYPRMSILADEWVREQRVWGFIEQTGKHPKINDPCPCQSGKKYKRCCFTRISSADQKVT